MKIINNIYLCLKFPFLYPRNAITDHHYTDWILENYINNTTNIVFKYICKFYYFLKRILHSCPKSTNLDTLPPFLRQDALQMCQELKSILVQHNCLYKYRILGIYIQRNNIQILENNVCPYTIISINRFKNKCKLKFCKSCGQIYDNKEAIQTTCPKCSELLKLQSNTIKLT